MSQLDKKRRIWLNEARPNYFKFPTKKYNYIHDGDGDGEQAKNSTCQRSKVSRDDFR